MTEISSTGSLERCMSSYRGGVGEDQELLVEWCYANDINLDDNWTTSVFLVTTKGQLVSDSTNVLITNLQSAALQLIPNSYPPAIAITPYNALTTRKILVRTHGENQFDRLLAGLLVWTNLRPAGVPKKWGFKKSIIEGDKSYGNEILVCRFKVYGPIPTKVKNLKVVPGPNVSIGTGYNNKNTNEGWFMAMGHLKRNGVLDLLLEIDGSLLYSIMTPILFNSEIRQLDHSIFQNSNILYLGIIPELRSSSYIKPIELHADQTKQFIIPPSTRSSNKHDLQAYELTCRILLEFPLHIDLEDWYVTLSSFTKREYIVDNRNFSTPKQLRSVHSIQLDVVEAKFDDAAIHDKKKVYTELMLWDSPWFRSSIVETYRDNPFWRESFHFDLPIPTDSFQLVIRESLDGNEYSVNDLVIGKMYLTSDILDPLTLKEIDRLTIYNHLNIAIGKMFINLHQQHHYILPAEEYKVFEKMIISIPFIELIEYIKPIAGTLNKLEEYSVMLVDIFQTLHRENEWFLALMDYELSPVDHLTRNNRMKGATSSKTANVFNTLFRGNSMLTKSLEKFNFRVGQEYLEKTIGEFVNKVSVEELKCEIDPKLIEAEYGFPDEQILKRQSLNLLHYIEELWDLIFKTSNDLPAPIKTQLKKFRLKVEHSVEPTDTTTPLNCLTAVIFLRFFCPAILNPKLLYLTKNHQSGDVQRTLTLIAKILLTLTNRSVFVEHKEPYLMSFNDFINRHQSEVLEYFDKLTGRKLDFQPKILELSDEVKRPSLNIAQEILEELPTNPYLIDKYSRIVELIILLNPKLASHSSLSHENKSILSSTSSDRMFKIGSLEDEDDMFKEFYEVNNDDDDDESLLQTDNFIKNLLLSSDDLEDLVKTHLKLQDLQHQSQLVLNKTKKLLNHFNKLELPNLVNFDAFIQSVFRNTFIELSSKKIYIVRDGTCPDPEKFKSISNGGLIMKITNRNTPLRVGGNGLLRSTSMSTLKSSSVSTLKGNEGTRNPFKKLFGRRN